MTENNHTGFSHIMPSASEHAWQEDLYQGVSEKIPADIIAEIFGSVSPNVKNLKIDSNTKKGFGVCFSHTDEPLDDNDFRRLLQWHNTDATKDNTTRGGSRRGVGGRSILAYYSNQTDTHEYLTDEWFINDGWMKCGLVISKVNKTINIKNMDNHNYIFNKEDEYVVVGFFRHPDRRLGTHFFIQGINNLKNGDVLKARHLTPNVENNVFFISPDIIKRNVEFDNFLKEKASDIIYNLRYMFSFSDCSFEINGKDIFKDKPGKLIDLEGDTWPALETETEVLERKKDKLKCAKITIKNHTLCNDISGNETYYIDLPSKNLQKDRFGSTAAGHMTKLSLEDWKQKEPWSEEDFKDSKTIYKNTLYAHARRTEGNKECVNYYNKSIKSVGLVRVDEDGVLYAREFHKGTTGTNMPYYLKGQRTDGAGSIKLKDKKYKYKNGQRFQGIVRENKSNCHSIFNKNVNRMDTKIKTRGETPGWETLLPYFYNCLWRTHCAERDGEVKQKPKPLTPEEVAKKAQEEAEEKAKQLEIAEKARKAAEAKAQANKIAKEEAEKARKAAEAKAKANAQAATKAQNEANYTKKKAADMEVKLIETEQQKTILKEQLEIQSQEYSSRGCVGLRKATIETQFGVNAFTSICPCCEGIMCVLTGMHHSHILSDAHGGSNSRENLVWLCQSCNSNMKQTHMAEYHKKRFPHKHQAFLEKLRGWGKKI